MRRALIWGLLAAFLAGCSDEAVGGDSLSLEGSATLAGSMQREGRLACVSDVIISMDMGEATAGSLTVRVRDGGNRLAMEEEVAAGGGALRTVSGSPGTWNVEAEASNLLGSFRVEASC